MASAAMRALISIVPHEPESVPIAIHRRILEVREAKIAALQEENRRLRATLAKHHMRTF